MALVGILAEYNPLHRGHVYQLEWARQHFPEEPVVVLMSGNVVQRGEFAILDKWHRAQAAVAAGADLVIELPTVASLQSADYFGRHGMTLLARLGCQRLVFGTEWASLDQLRAYLAWEADHESALDVAMQAALATGLAYPAAYEQAVQSLADWSDLAPWRANHQLALQYLKTLAQVAPAMTCHALPRLQSLAGRPVRSGSAIRQAFRQGEDVTEDLAPGIGPWLTAERDAPWEAYWPLLRYQLLMQSTDQLSQWAGVKEGLAHRLKAQAAQHSDWLGWRQAMVSKRWTQAAIQRVALAVLLQLPQAEVTAFNQGPGPRALRLLDASTRGQAQLAAWRKREDLVVFSQYKPAYEADYGWNLRADTLYELHPAGQIQSQLQPRQAFSFLQGTPIQKNPSSSAKASRND